MIRRLFLAWAGGVLLLGGVYLTAVSALSPIRQETMAQHRVFAYRGWQSLGIRLQPEDRVTLRARGEWLYTPGEYHGPEGHARYPAPAFYPLPHVAGGALIGRIGESGEPFLVGKHTSIYAPAGGMLYLRIDDDILTDNEGWVDVQVDVQPAAEDRP